MCTSILKKFAVSTFSLLGDLKKHVGDMVRALASSSSSARDHQGPSRRNSSIWTSISMRETITRKPPDDPIQL